MNKVITLAALVGLSACASQTPIVSGSVADGVSTGIAISQGAVEANPVINTLCPTTEPVLLGLCVIGMQAATTEILVRFGVPEDTINRTRNVVGWGVAANNLAIAAGASTPVGLTLWVLTSAFVYDYTKPNQEE